MPMVYHILNTSKRFDSIILELYNATKRCNIMYIFQGLVKSYMLLTNGVRNLADLNFLIHLYMANKFNVENRRMLLKFIRWNLIITQLLTAAFLVTTVVLISVPLAIFFKTGRMEPIIPAHIPFVPRDQLWGYALHNIYFISCIVTGYAGTVANDMFFLTLIMHIWPMYKIMDQAIIGLNQATGSLRKEAIRNSTWLHFRVRNIALMHKRIYL